MKITIVPQDKKIRIDDECLYPIEQDLSWIPSNVRAVQWYDTYGEVEFNDQSANEIINELGIYEQAIDTFNLEKQRIQEKIISDEQAFEASRDYWNEFRMIRDGKLFECDWTQALDSPLSESQKISWQTYRQQLRDLPEIITDPKPLALDVNHPLWPIQP